MKQNNVHNPPLPPPPCEHVVTMPGVRLVTPTGTGWLRPWLGSWIDTLVTLRFLSELSLLILWLDIGH
jgi:hypothetical protein